MSIRLRTVDGVRVAICAARSMPLPNDVYLDDADHHALAQKFSEDFASEGMNTGNLVEPYAAGLRAREESNNPNQDEWDVYFGQAAARSETQTERPETPEPETQEPIKLRSASESVGWLNSVGPLTTSPAVPLPSRETPAIENSNERRSSDGDGPLHLPACGAVKDDGVTGAVTLTHNRAGSEPADAHTLSREATRAPHPERSKTSSL